MPPIMDAAYSLARVCFMQNQRGAVGILNALSAGVIDLEKQEDRRERNNQPGIRGTYERI